MQLRSVVIVVTWRINSFQVFQNSTETLHRATGVTLVLTKYLSMEMEPARIVGAIN